MEELPDFVVVGSTQLVEAWSVRRLPFEPRASMLEFRAALRAGLAGLAVGAGPLRCVYSSPSTDFCDAENVLLYNVGMSSFVRLTERGVTFERSFVVPPSPVRLSGPPLHHHAYSTNAQAAFLHWQVDGEVASWEGAIPHRLDKAADWWWSTRSGSRTMTDVDLTSQRYGLRLRLGGMRRSTGSVLKPMLDGVIAAFHRDASLEDETIRRLAGQLHQTQDGVRVQLAAADAPLGTRVLLRPFRDGLQWNPADDLCVACTVEVAEPSPAMVKGQLLRLSPMTTRDMAR